MPLEILYEDNHLIAVNKPAGMPVQGDASGDSSLFEFVKKYLKETYQKPGNVFVGLLHRLDRPVGGIILFAKTSKGASRLSEQFRKHTVRKVYDAVVSGTPRSRNETLVHYLIKNEASNKVSVFDNQVPGAQRAELRYEVIGALGKNTLIRVELLTGRPHQIRAQLSAIGCPIIGDVKYGGVPWSDPSAIALNSGFLSFETPTTHERKTISLPVPAAWKNLLT